MDQISCTNDFFQLLKLIKNSPPPNFPEYAIFSRRLQSLNEFSAPIHDKLHLAEAGFFFNTTDSVQCWTCGIILENWLKGDCPFREHAKYSKNCSYILVYKGTKFVNNVNNNFKFKNLNYYCMHDQTEHDSIDI